MPEYKEVTIVTSIGYERTKHMDGYEAWLLNGQRHREGGPAIIYPNGCEEWWLNGKRHRPDGPAVNYSRQGYASWYLEGTKLNLEQIEKMRYLWICPLEELPLYMNTEFRTVVEWRLKNA